jgi:hypothetical protein
MTISCTTKAQVRSLLTWASIGAALGSRTPDLFITSHLEPRPLRFTDVHKCSSEALSGLSRTVSIPGVPQPLLQPLRTAHAPDSPASRSRSHTTWTCTPSALATSATARQLANGQQMERTTQRIASGRAFAAGLRTGRLEHNAPAGHQLSPAAAAPLQLVQGFLNELERAVRAGALWQTNADAVAAAQAKAERLAASQDKPMYAITAAELARLAPVFLPE